MTRMSWFALTALVLFLGWAAAHAHRGAAGIVKQRMDAMTSKEALRTMMRGTRPYDTERVKAHAATIAEYGGEKLTAAASNERPPDAVFKRLQQTCSDCHRTFRTKK